MAIKIFGSLKPAVCFFLMATTRPHAGNGHLDDDEHFHRRWKLSLHTSPPVDDDVIKGHALIASGGLSSLKDMAAEDKEHSVWWVVEGWFGRRATRKARSGSGDTSQPRSMHSAFGSCQVRAGIIRHS